MTEEQAIAIAGALGGETWQSGGNIWLVMIRRADGRVVVFSDDAICEYEDDDAFDEGRPVVTISLH